MTTSKKKSTAKPSTTRQPSQTSSINRNRFEKFAVEDDDKKLARTVRYLNKTKHLPHILSSDDTGVIEWWVDAAFAVHDDMKSHTGGAMSLGRGVFDTKSTK